MNSDYESYDEEDEERQARPQRKNARQSKPRERKKPYEAEIDDDGNEVPLTEKKIERYRKQAKNVAYYWLGRQDQTTAKIIEKLTMKGIPPFVVDETIKELEESQYLDDEKYAQNYVNSKMHYDRKGKNAIRYELMRKNVDKEVIEQALESVSTEDEEANARELLEKKLRSVRGLDRQKQTQRLVGMLARKGYNAGMAFSLVREFLDQHQETEEFEDE